VSVRRPDFRRVAAMVAGLWAGLLLCLGAVATRTVFAEADMASARRVARSLLAQEAYIALGVTMLLFVLLRQQARRTVTEGSPLPKTDLFLVLGALFCTVAGYFALQPMMAAAMQAQDFSRFGMLHGVSTAFFALKGLLVLVLAWRLTAAA
jgi:hypothetical protein